MAKSKGLFLLGAEALILAVALLFLLPASPSFSFALKIREDSPEDFADGSFRFAALTPEGGVRLLPLWTGGQWVTDSQRLPVALSSLSAVAWQGKILVVGGDDQDGCRRREVYSATINPDGSLQPWVALPESSWLPAQGHGTDQCPGTGRDGLSSGALVLYPHSETTATLYYIGGIRDDNTTSPKVYMATVTATTGEVSGWTETTPLDEYGLWGKYYHSALAVEGFIFVIGGNIGTGAANASPTDEVCKAPVNPDGSLGGWGCAWGERLPRPLRNLAAVYYTGELSRTIYVIGGEDNTGALRTEVLFADVITTSTPPTPTLTGWFTSSGGSLPQPLGSHGAVEARGEIFLMGGEVGLGQQVSNTVQLALVDEESPETRLYDWGSSIGSWVGGPILPQERSLHATVVWQNFIYVIGGDGPETLPQRKNTVYRGNIEQAGTGEAYYAPKGLYTSNPIRFEPGRPVTVTLVKYNASVPPDTGLRFRERHQTGSGWSDWSGWTSLITGTSGFNLNLAGVSALQYQLELTRGQLITLTPALDWIEFYYEVPDPTLSITKTSYLGIASPGDILDYILTFSNTGGIILPQAVITEELPEGTGFAGWGWNPAGGNLYTRTVSVGSYGSLGQARFRIKIGEGILSEYITNTVWISHPPITDAQGNVYTFEPVSATYTIQITGIRSFPKSASPPPESIVYWGQPVTYTITFTNFYRTNFSTVNITDPVSALLWDVTPYGGGILENGVLSWTLGSLSHGEAREVTFTARISPGLPAGTPITNAAYSQAFVPGEPEPVLSQVSNWVTHTVRGTVLSISKSSAPPPGSQVRWYDPITYTITVTNAGYYTFTVALTDTLDTYALDFVSASPGGSYSGNTVAWTVGPLGPGASAVVTVAARVKCGLEENYEITNTARATAEASDVFQSNSVTHTVAGPAALTLAKVSNPPPGSPVSPGTAITYTIHYTNTGQSPAAGVVITDPLDPGLQHLSGGTLTGSVISWTVGRVEPGASGFVTFTAQVKSNASGTITNYAYISAECLGVVQSNPVTHTVSAPAPYLVVSKASQPLAGSAVQAGDLITYSIRITNTGSVPAYGVMVTDPLDLRLQFVSGSPTPAYSSGVLSWTVGSLAPESSWSATFTARVVTCTAGIISNTAYAAGQGLGLKASEMVTHAIAGCPALSVSKGSVPPPGSPVFPGDLITYTLYFTNSGGIARNLVLTDLLPAGVTLVDSGGASVSDGSLFWSGLSLGQGASGQKTFIVQVNPSLPRCQAYTITNEFYGVEARESYGNFPGSRGAKVEHPVAFIPDLSVSVSDGKGLISSGEILTYIITYTNLCGLRVESAVLGITLSNGLNAGSNPGWSGSGNYYTRSVGLIEAGASGRVNFSAQVASSPPGSVGVTVTIWTSGREWDPWNNIASDWDVTGGVDLVISRLEVSPASVPITGTMRVTVTALNQGNQAVGRDVGLLLYLKPHPSPPPSRSGDWDGILQACPDRYGGYCFEWVPAGNLGASGLYTAAFSVSPAAIGPGVYDLYAYIDVGDSLWHCNDNSGCVLESCEVNNWAGWRGVQVTGGNLRKVFLPLVLRNWGR